MGKNYSVNNVSVEELLGWIKQGRIGLPEMQRPFVWSTSKVRDLIDSLYNGYPIGYIVTWQNPSAGLKGEQSSGNKELIIDGQQRLTALKAALNGDEVIDKRYKRERIMISFKPSTEEFETSNVATQRNPLWIDDIAVMFQPEFNSFQYVSENAERLGMGPNDLGMILQKLHCIILSEIGNIELGAHLNIEAVTDIFNRINSKGVSLSSADLAMSRLSADTIHGGNRLRKQADYFVQLLNDPTLLANIEAVDLEFAQTKEFQQVKWIATEQSRIYSPNYSDILHVILAEAFQRGKLTDMVSLISGRDFERRDFNEEAMDRNYQLLNTAAQQVFNRSNFRRFLMILQDMGMRNNPKLGLVGHGVLNFAYILFLFLQGHTKLSKDEVDHLVKRWIVMSALTGRYGSSSESIIERDIRLIAQADNPAATMESILAQELSDNFWTVTMPDNLERQSTSVSSWRIFQMAQAYAGDIAWLAKDTKALTVMEEEGDIHHIFPRAYLNAHHIPKSQINQLANFTWLTQPRNLDISDMAPNDYLHDSTINQFFTAENNRQNAIPTELANYDYRDYPDFLKQRRQLMATKIRNYYEQL